MEGAWGGRYDFWRTADLRDGHGEDEDKACGMVIWLLSECMIAFVRQPTLSNLVP